MNRKTITESLKLTLIAGLLVLLLYPGYEATIARAIEDQFTITQTITSEISFLTASNDVTMVGSIAGLTGGTSYGTSTHVVKTNDAAGFTETIKASSSPAMQGNTQGGTIADYTPAAPGIPDFAFSVPTGEEFSYSVSASTTGDLAAKFKDNGTTCNTGALDTSVSSCWYGLSTVATSTMLRTSPTSNSGATSSIYFIVKVNSGSALPEDTYTATTTITATTN